MSTATTLYCTVDDLKSLFGEGEVIAFSDKDRSGAEDTAALNLAIKWASAKIEAMLNTVYDFPLASIPDQLRTICCHMVRWYLYSDAPTKGVILFYNDALADLKAIAEGTQTLGSAYDTSLVGGVQYSTNTRSFTRDGMGITTDGRTES